MSLPTTKIVLHKQRQNKDGLWPVTLRVTFEGQPRYFRFNLFMSEKDFERIICDNRLSKDQKAILTELNQIRSIADDIIEKMEFFDWDVFKEKFYNKDQKQERKRDLLGELDQAASEFRAKGQAGYADTYDLAKTSLKSFHGGASLPYSLLRPDWFEKYEQWMMEKGNSPTTVGIYLRCVRKLLNEKKSAGTISAKQYPFGKGKYQIPSGRSIKKGLDANTLQKLFRYKPTTEAKRRWLSLWKFIYLANGLNVADLMLLKWDDIKGEEIVFFRQKTKRTRKQNPLPIRVPISDPMRTILSQYGTEVNHKNYIFFDSLPSDPTILREYRRNVVKYINKAVKTAAKELGITEKITTYTARHTFATNLAEAGVNTRYIQESLGHSNQLTTERYIGSLINSTKSKAIDAITKGLDLGE